MVSSQSFTSIIERNNVRAHVVSAGLLFNNLGVTEAGFEVPKDANNTQGIPVSIFASSLWLGGIDAGNTIYVAAQTYRQRGNDYVTGPIDATNPPPSFFDKLWRITKADVDSLKLTGLPNNNVSSWPGIYNTSSGNEQLAPYFDNDGDGVYDPIGGDYPIFPGDEALFFSYNDDVLHTESLSSSLFFDVKGFVYQYTSTTNEFLNNTVFVDYYITNKSNREYVELNAGAWTDFDLGDFADDRIGTDINRNMYYAYNASDSDGVYCKNPPAMGVAFLNQKLAASISYTNDFSSLGNPTLPQHYHYYLNGLWKDGSAMSDKGNGYNTGGTNTKFIFSGNPCTQTGWTEVTGGVSPGDRRMLGSVSFSNFKPNEQRKFTVAYTWARAATGGANNSLCKLLEQTDSLQNWFDKQPALSTQKIEMPKITIYPNPATQNVTIDLGEISDNVEISLYDITGKLITTITEKTINVSGLAKGLYIIKGKAGESHFTKKLQVE